MKDDDEMHQEALSVLRKRHIFWSSMNHTVRGRLELRLNQTFKETLMNLLTNDSTSSTLLQDNEGPSYMPSKSDLLSYAHDQWDMLRRWLVADSNLKGVYKPGQVLLTLFRALDLDASTVSTAQLIPGFDGSAREATKAAVQLLLKDTRSQQCFLLKELARLIFEAEQQAANQMQAQQQVPANSNQPQMPSTVGLESAAATAFALTVSQCRVGSWLLKDAVLSNPGSARMALVMADIGMLFPTERHFVTTHASLLLQPLGPEGESLGAALTAATADALSKHKQMALRAAGVREESVADAGALSLGDHLFHPRITELQAQIDLWGGDAMAVSSGKRSTAYEPVGKSKNKGALVGAPELGFLVQPNFKVYASTSSKVLVGLLARFCSLQCVIGGLVVGVLTRGKCVEAYRDGVKAIQILSFLRANVHPILYAKHVSVGDPLIPHNVAHQIVLWEDETKRLKVNKTKLVAGFKTVDEFRRSVAFCEDRRLSLWHSPLPAIDSTLDPAQIARLSIAVDLERKTDSVERLSEQIRVWRASGS